MSSNQSGQLHTPSQSFSFGHTFGNGITAPTPPQAVDLADQRFREEYEVAKSRLADSKFKMRDYADPLLPRQRPDPKYYPREISPELESHLLGIIAKAKPSS